MKIQFAIAVLASALMGAAGFAEAGGPKHGYGGGHHNAYGSNHYMRYETRRYHGYSNRYHRRNYGHYGYGHYRGHYDYHDGLRIAAGAVVLGSLIYAINSDRREKVVYRTKRVSPANDYRYQLDADGQCYELALNQQGQEVWTYVDSSYCY